MVAVQKINVARSHVGFSFVVVVGMHKIKKVLKKWLVVITCVSLDTKHC